MTRELEQLERDFASLDGRLREIESQPSPRFTPEGHLARIEEWAKQAETLVSEVKTSLANNQQNVAQHGVEALAVLKRNAEELARAIEGMHGKEAPKVITAKPLADEIQSLTSQTEGVVDKAGTKGASNVANRGESLLDELRNASGRVGKILKRRKPPVEKGAMATLLDLISKASAEANSALSKYVPPPTLPFKEEDATLVIAATGDVTETLILPMLRSRSNGSVTKSPDARWFYAGNEEKVIVYRSDEGALRDLITGQVDLAMIDRPATREESRLFAGAFANASLNVAPHAKVVCLDALTFSVHPRNQKATISQSDLSNLGFLGGLPGTAERIAAERYGLRIASEAKGMRPVEALMQNPDAVAVGLYHQEAGSSTAKRLSVSGGPTKESVQPNASTIGTEDYPLSFRITAHTSPKSRSAAAELVNYCLSEPGQDQVSKQGYVDLRLEATSEPVDPVILAAIQSSVGTGTLKSITRLSTALHFDVDEDRLDYKALADLERVPAILARGQNGSKLVIVGFTDSTGTSEINVPLSKRRADSVAAVLNRAGFSATTVGLGDQTHTPESNLTEEGRYRNRRANIYVVQL